MATQQTAGINAANRLFNILQGMQALRQQINDYVLQYNDNNWSALWSALATAPLNTDGSLGTADGTPNTAHPIDTRVTNLGSLQCDRSATDYINAVAMIEAFQNFLSNGIVAQANRNAVLDLFQQG